MRWEMYVMILLLMVMQARSDSVTAAKDIKKKILKDYDKESVPEAKTIVEINQLIINNFKMDDRGHAVQITAGMGQTWRDPRLTWNPSEHQGLQKVAMKYWSIWSPDVVLQNAARPSWSFMWSFEPLTVYSDGKVDYMPFYNLNFACTFDMTYWPHDTHNCSFTIKSWLHGSHTLDYNLNVTPKVDISRKISPTGEKMSDWDVSDVAITRSKNVYPCCKEPYVDLTISMIFTRRAPAYNWTLKAPVVCLCFLTMVLFLLPPDAGEKIIFSGLNLMFNGFCLSYSNFIIAASPSHTPLLVQMASQQLLLATLSIIAAAIVFRISRNPHSSGIPPAMKGPVLGLSRLLLLGNYADLVSASHKSFTWTLQGDQVELADDTPAAIRQREKSEWLLLAALVDRLLLILYCVSCLISFIRFSSVL